jgi:hypothetical protein
MPVLPAAVEWVRGICTILQHIRAQGDSGHIVNTASVRWTDVTKLGTAN